MDKNLSNIQEQHINPYDRARKEHQPQEGDIYTDKNPSFNSSGIFRLLKRNERGLWECENISDNYNIQVKSDNTLKEYYVWLQNGDNLTELMGLAQMLTDGRGEEVAQMITGELNNTPSDSESLMATESPEHIAALLDTSERLQNKLQEVHLIAKCMIETRKRDMEMMLRSMDGQLAAMKEKVGNLIKVITILNLYTGNTVEVNQIADGETADPKEPLTLRQRILFMDEELCVHLDHEADYQDIPLFFEWLKEPANRDIIVPEQRCAVCLKPKRFNMDYRSRDALYDNLRNQWNKHTYIVIRNGEKLFWLESEDLEVFEWAFPHSDIQEEYEKRIKENPHWKESIIKESESVSYRVTKYMTFLQGLLDQREDIIGPVKNRPNFLKLQGVELIRDDENLIGTGLKPWSKFKEEKNALIKRGTRILYIAGRKIKDGINSRPWNTGGEHLGYYRSEYTEPAPPDTGIYHADTIEVVDHYDHGEPVRKPMDKLIFRYNPGDKVYDHTGCDWEGHERKKRLPWKYDLSAVLNYDAVSAKELREYLNDRTLRPQFREMMPTLKKALLLKEQEEAQEDGFILLMVNSVTGELGWSQPYGTKVNLLKTKINQCIQWWKEKVIFTRPLTSDDAKAFKMIKQRVIKEMKNNERDI